MRRSIDSPPTPASRTGVAALLGAVAGGVIIGLIPNVIFSALGTSLRVVLGTTGFFVVVLAVVKLVMIRSSRELGIVLDLDPGDGRQWDGHAARVALSQAKAEQGRVADVIAVTLPTDPVRRDEALRSVLGMVNKASGARRRPVSLYPNATLHDSYALGRLIKTGSFPMTLMQKAQSKDGTTWFHRSCRLGDHLSEPLSGSESREAERFLACRPEELAAEGDRLALMIVLSKNASLIAPSMRAAAETGRSDRYAIGPADRCRAALVVRADDGRVPPDPESFELTVRYVHAKWSTWLDEQDEQQAPGEHLLFLAAPTTLALALGWVYGREGMRMIADGPPPIPGPSTSVRQREDRRG